MKVQYHVIENSKGKLLLIESYESANFDNTEIIKKVKELLKRYVNTYVLIKIVPM